MQREKMYLPMSDDYTRFIGLTSSKEGLVIPIFVEGTVQKFHVTAFIKKIHEGFFYNIHLTDQIEKYQVPLLKGVISNEAIEKLSSKINELVQELIPIINKYQVDSQDIDREKFHCVECALLNNKLPKKFSETKSYWKNMNNTTDIELLRKTKVCTNETHRTYFDEQNNAFIFKYSQNVQFRFNDFNQFTKEIETIVNKKFSSEIKILECTIDKIIQRVQKEIDWCS
jgi:hypothetical protein